MKSNVMRKPRTQNRMAPARKRALNIEMLESRALPSAATWPGLISPVASSTGIGTLDQAQSLGDLSATPSLAVVGDIASGSPAVDWYTFTLDSPTHVTVTTLDVQGHSSFISDLSLYNTDFDPTNDPYVPTGWRLLAQDDGANHGGDAHIDRSLSPGTYYVAVSGSGNRFFHPDIADSGIPGSSGPYGLSITGQDLGLGANDGPVVLATDLLSTPGANLPANASAVVPPDTVIDRSPFVIRVDTSAALDPNTINPGVTVQLTDLTTGQPIGVTAYFDASANELKLTPAQPLAPDEYQLTLSGNNANGSAVIQDVNGNPLAANLQNPTGQDYTFTFLVAGSEGSASTTATSDGVPSTAHQLGDLSQTNLIQSIGSIGDDPTDAVPFNPADIDLYHFQLSGSANYAVRLEAFAGRIGSPLDAAISLFRVNPVDGLLHLVALSDGTGNMTQTFAGTQTPLASDSRLTVALTAGDYYIAVTGLGYAPAALTNPLVPAPYSVFDPTVPTPFGGTTTGDYVLNVSVVADNTPPKVASVSVNSGTPLVDGAILAAPPTGFSIVYSEPVNLEQPAAQAFALNNDPRLNYVYIVGPSGTFYPRFASFTDDGATAQFRMYDPLPSGTYELHLSGPGGLTDFAGNPLVGNTPSGDFVITFTVNAPSRGSSQGPRTWIVHNQQNIGPLFPTELQHVVTLVQPASATLSAPTTDAFQVQLTQNKRYTFSLTSSVLPPGMQFSVTDSSGTPVKGRVARSPGKIVIIALLSPDVYTIHVSGWSAKAGFSVNISIDLAAEAAPPLTIGPGAGVPLRSLAGVAPAPPPAPPTDNGSSPKFPSAGSNGAIIVAVGLTGGATASRPLDPGSVPSEVLAGLGTGQLGSITGTSAGKGPDVYDRLLSGGLDPSFTQLIVQLPILVQVHDSGTGQENAATFAPAALVQEIVRVLSNIDWSAVGEVLQRIENWSMDHLLPVTPPVEDEFLPGIDVPAMPKAPEPALPPRQEDDGATSEASIQALAFTAALAGAGRERERRWRTGASRRKGVVKGS